jgi:hypothetical protein
MTANPRCMLTIAAASGLLACGWLAKPTWAASYSPWVTSEHVPDTSSLQAYRNYPAWKDLTGRDLALAAWHAFIDTETGVAHFQPIREGADPVDWEFRIIRDPIKMLNSYGYGFCGAFGPTTAGLFEGLGFERARSVQLPKVNHNVTEVWYDGQWHYFDTDLRGVLLERDGKTIASIEDVIREPDLWLNPPAKLQPFFPEDRPENLKSYSERYGAVPPEYNYHWFHGGSTMDFVLRKGETLTRFWHPQGGRWSHQKEDAQTDFFRQLIEREPRGAKTNHPKFTIWTHGNGLFDYAPRLRAGSTDFEDGAFARANVELTDEGLTLATDGKGEAVFEVCSPYVIVPLVGELDDRTDDREASVVEFASTGDVGVSISTDFGRSYQSALPVAQSATTSLDLTPHLTGERHQYLVKFTLRGKKGQTALTALRIRTWVQVAPISLPRLKQGLNHLHFALHDKHGLPTTPSMQIPNMGDAQEMARYWVAPPEDYNPARRNPRLVGPMELIFDAPPGKQIKWASLGGYFSSYQKAEAPNTANEMWYAVNDADDWTLAYRANVPDWQSHWHYAYDQEILLDKPVERLRVRYVGKPGVNGVRVNLHSLKREPVTSDPVTVTHTFKMDGNVQTKTFTFDKPSDYTIQCPSTPEDISIQLAVPSDPGK